MKVLIVGVDGASWRVLDRLFEQGRMPNCRQIVDQGVHGHMDNQGEYESPVIWTTIATGQPPEKHRIFGFTSYFGAVVPFRGRHLPRFSKLPSAVQTALIRLGVVYKGSVRSFQRKSKALWAMASQASRTVGLVNWWVTFPPEPVAGFIVSDMANYARLVIRTQMGLGTLKGEGKIGVSGTVRPPVSAEEVASWHPVDDDRLLREARSLARIDEDMAEEFRNVQTFRRESPMSVLRYSIYQDQFALNALKRMTAKFGCQPDVLGIYLGGLDGVCHALWKYAFPEDFLSVDSQMMDRYGDTVFSYYCWVDELIGDLMELVDAGETVVVVVSDHGFESVPDGEGPPGLTGSHDNAPHGVFMMSGPAVRAAQEVDVRSVDIVPTLMYLLGLPVGRDMAGEVREMAIEPAVLAAAPVQFVDSWESIGDDYTASERATVSGVVDKEVVDRLRALGYFE